MNRIDPRPGIADDGAPFPEVFVVGTGRCGSTLVSNLLRLHPDVLSLSEFFMALASRAFVYPRLSGAELWCVLSRARPTVRMALSPERCPDEFLYRFGPGSPFTPSTLPPIAYITLPHLTDDPDRLYFELEPVIRAAPRAPLADQYRLLFTWLRDRLGKKLWAERSGGSLVMVEPLRRLFPGAKFVHVIRDGRDVALSIARHPPTRLFAHNWLQLRRFGVDLLRPPFRMGDSRLIAWVEPFMTPFAAIEAKLDAPLSPEALGAFWSEMIEVGLADLARVPPEQRHDLRYEELIDNPREELTKLAAFLDPRLLNEDWLGKAAALPRPKRAAWRGLPPERRRALEDTCAPGLRLLGYL